jgi:hypothetical protein
MVTLKVHVEVLLAASVALHVTGVVPTENALPLAGPEISATVTPGQLSDAVGVEYVTFLVQPPGSAGSVMFAGQAMDGFWLSTTVTTKLWVVCLPYVSVALCVTVVCPTGKKLPLAGPAVL